MLSREEKEHDASLSLGEEEDARGVAYFPQIKPKGGEKKLWLNYHSLTFVFKKSPPELFQKVTKEEKIQKTNK